MRTLWSFFAQKTNREILTWIGSGLTVAVAGLWTTLVYFSAPPKTPAGQDSSSIEATCGSIGIGGNISGATLTAGNTGACPEQRP